MWLVPSSIHVTRLASFPYETCVPQVKIDKTKITWSHDLNQSSLSDKDLVDIKENVTSFHNHSLNCQILPNIFCLADLIKNKTALKGDWLKKVYDCTTVSIKILLNQPLRYWISPNINPSITWQLGNGLRTLNTLSQKPEHPENRVSIHTNKLRRDYFWGEKNKKSYFKPQQSFPVQRNGKQQKLETCIHFLNN